MPKIKTVVKNTPVRYNGEDYEPGDEVVIDEAHFIESLFEKGDEVEEVEKEEKEEVVVKPKATTKK